MPNKHKNAKLRTKLLLGGKLNNKKEVQNTLKYLAEKDAIEKEDVDFDFEKQPNDFGQLEDGDDFTKKVKNPKKRKNPIYPKEDTKKVKLNERTISKTNSKSDDLVPKKSKKNKYFFVAHPEALSKKEEILSTQTKNKFIIDQKKIEKNLEKKKIKPNKLGAKSKIEKKTKNDEKPWTIQECTSEEEETVNKIDKKKKATSKNFILDITDIDKSFKIKKTIKKLEDGSKVEVFAPEIQQQLQESDEEESGNEDTEPGDIAEIEEKDEDKNDKTNSSSIFTGQAADKLKSSRFRYLNELLYSQDSSKSFEYFKSDTDSFKAYHEGFKSQISKWPLNPLDNIIKFIKNRSSSLIVADLGCGEARLAQSVKNKVHSFDFVALSDQVVQCDMKKVPLDADSCDIAVFCLSLMGTNVIDFICEAHRILKLKGVLKIAEVTSRISNKNDFIRSIESVGFKLVSKKDETTDSKEYFYFFDFVKTSPTIRKKAAIKLNPCLYKKR